MEIHQFIETNEYIVEPYTSINRIEKELFERGYVVLKDETRFYGILTIRDLAQNYHQLAIDCLTPKPEVSLYSTLDSLIELFLTSKQMVLPVFNEFHDYTGSIMFRNLVKEILFSMRGFVSVEIKNIKGDEDVENAKYHFISEMLHNTKNPIQNIISATSLLESNPDPEDRIILLNAIRNSAEQISIIFDKLLSKYLEM